MLLAMIENPTARWLIAQVLNGNLFYIGMALLGLAGAMRLVGSWRPMYRWRGVGRALLAAGVVAVILGASAGNVWWLVWLTTLAAAGIVHRHRRQARSVAAMLCAVTLVIACVTTWRYEWGAAASEPAPSRLVVFGDSLSSAFDIRPEASWPNRLGRALDVRIENLSVPGAKTADVAGAMPMIDVSGAMVVLAVGGNDVLGGTSPRQYAAELDAALGHLTDHAENVVFIEPPVPPSLPWYAWIQRHVARRHGVRLMPKRVLADAVFARSGATLDGLHLTAEGHAGLADHVESWLRHWYAFGRQLAGAPRVSPPVASRDMIGP